MIQIDALTKAMNEYLADMPDNTAEDGKMRAAFRVAFRCGWTACNLQAVKDDAASINARVTNAESADCLAMQEFHETLSE